MIRRGQEWQETDWSTALAVIEAALKKVLTQHGPSQLGALAAPTSTLEEFYLLQKLVRGLGSGNVDHRLRQMDFSDDAIAPSFPSLGRPLCELDQLDAALLIGSHPRKDQPLINMRLRRAVLKGAKVFAINPLHYDHNYKLSGEIVGSPSDMLRALASVARAVADSSKTVWPDSLAKRFGQITPSEAERAMAEALVNAKQGSILLGTFGLSHPQAASLRALAQFIAEKSGCTFGQLPEANAAGAWLAGCVPHRGVGEHAAIHGRDAAEMLRQPLKAYLLLGVEPEFDCLDSATVAALNAADLVVMMTAFKPSADRLHAVDYAHVWLPLAPYTETDGTFVNVEGRQQSFTAAVSPLGEARPGWKILRQLGHQMNVSGFGQNSIEDVRQELKNLKPSSVKSGSYTFPPEPPALKPSANQLMRLATVPLYTTDALVRRAPALQQTADNPPPTARINSAQASKLGLKDGASVQVIMVQGKARLDLVLDESVPDGCVWVPAGYPETCMLGAHGPASLVAAS